jgi:Flp pilus assembly pilin Flp
MKTLRAYAQGVLMAVVAWAVVMGIIWIVTSLADAFDHIQ